MEAGDGAYGGWVMEVWQGPCGDFIQFWVIH